MVTQTYWKSFIKMQLGRFRCLKWFRKVAGSFFLGYPRFKFKYFIYCIFIIICVAFGPQNMQTCAALYQQVWCFSCDFPGFVEESTNFLQNVKTCTWEQKTNKHWNIRLSLYYKTCKSKSDEYFIHKKTPKSSYNTRNCEAWDKLRFASADFGEHLICREMSKKWISVKVTIRDIMFQHYFQFQSLW